MEENTSPHDRRDSLKNPNQSGGIASPSKRTPFKNISNNISPLKPADNSWVERTEVITKQNPENHKRFAKDLIEEIIPKVLDISKRKLPFREQRLKSQEESDSDLETEFEPNESAVHCPAASPDVSTNSLNNDTLSESKLSEQLVASSTPAARNPASLSPVDAIHKEIKGALELLKCFEKLGVSSPNTCKISLEKAKFRSADNFFNPFSTNSKLKTSNEELHKTFDNQIKDLELLLEDGTAQPHDCTLEELYETAQLIPGDESFNLTKEFNNIKLVDKSLSQGNYDSTGVGNVVSVEDFPTDVKELTVEESVIQSEGSALNEEDPATSCQETSMSKSIYEVSHEVMDGKCVVVDSAANATRDELETNTLVTKTVSGDTSPSNNRVQGTDVTTESTSASTTVSEGRSNTEELCAVTQTCTATVDPSTSSQKVNTIVHTSVSEDGATDIESCESYEPKLSEAGKCKVETEEEEIVVPSKEYDVDALSKLDDPDFNPFPTKSAVCKSSDSKTIIHNTTVTTEITHEQAVPAEMEKEAKAINKSTGEDRSTNVEKSEDKLESSEKEKSMIEIEKEETKINLDKSLTEGTTPKTEKCESELEPLDKNEKELSLTASEDEIIPKKEYDTEVLSRLDDPDFNPFATKSAVFNSPDSKSINQERPLSVAEDITDGNMPSALKEEAVSIQEVPISATEASVKEGVCTLQQEFTSDNADPNSAQEDNTIEKSANEDSSNVEKGEDKLESCEKETSMIKIEEEIIVPSKEYDVDVLSRLKDPTFNPFTTKSAVCNSPESKTIQKSLPGTTEIIDEMEEEAKTIGKSGSEDGSVNVEKNEDELESSGKENLPLSLAKEATDQHVSALSEEVRNLKQESTSDQSYSNTHSQKAKRKSNDKSSEDGLRNNENCEDKPKLSEAEKSKVEVEEEEIVVPSKEYDVNALSKLDDPDFNPFATKSAVCNSPDSKSINQERPLSVPEDTTDGNVPSALKEEAVSIQDVPSSVTEASVIVKEESKNDNEISTSKQKCISDHTKPSPATQDSRTVDKPAGEDVSTDAENSHDEPLFSNEKENSNEIEEQEIIAPSKEYDVDVLSRLEDPNFNPFTTKSAVCDSPESKSLNEHPPLPVAKETTDEHTVSAVREVPASTQEFSTSDNAVSDTSSQKPKTDLNKSITEETTPKIEKCESELEPLDENEKELSLTASEEVIIPKKEYDREVLSKLDDPDFNPFATKSAVCNSPDSKSIIHNTTVTTEIILEEVVPEIEVKTIENSASEDNSTNVEKSEDKLESSGKGKSMIEIEAENFFVPSKEYDDVLSKLEDPTFNPFVTKSAVCNAPESTNMNQSTNVSVSKEPTDEHAAPGRDEVPSCNTTFKEENTSLDKFATEENATPMEDCEDALEEKPSLKSDDENVIVPVKKLDLDFLSQLDDPNFNPFATKSAVSNSPDSKNIPKEIVETESPNETLTNSDTHLNEVLENTEGKRTSPRGNLLTNEDDTTKTKPLSFKSPQNNNKDFEIDTNTLRETPSDTTVVFDDSVFSTTVTEECSSSKSGTVATTIDDHIPGSVSRTKTGFETEEFSSDFSVLDTIAQERESERLQPPTDVFRKSICSLEFDEIAIEAIDLAKELTPLTARAKQAEATNQSNKYSDFSGEEFASATEFFSTEMDLEALCSLGSCSTTANVAPRDSLFVKFDPLIAACRDNDIDPRRGSALISFSPMKKPASVPGSTLLPRSKVDGSHVTLADSSSSSRLLSPPDQGRDSSSLLGGEGEGEGEEEEEAETTILIRTQERLLPPTRIHATTHATKVATTLATISATRETQTEEKVVSVAERDATLKKTEIIYQGILLKRSREFEEMKSVLVEEIKRKEEEVKKMEEEKKRISKMASLFQSLLTEIVAKKAKMESEFGEGMKEEAKRREEEVRAVKRELSSQQEEMAQSERTFFDLVKKQERLRQIVESVNRNNSILKSENQDLSGKIKDQKDAFITAFKDMESNIREANEKFDADHTQHENEMNKAGMLLKRAEMKIVLQADALTKKDAEIRMMTALMDDWSKKFDA